MSELPDERPQLMVRNLMKHYPITKGVMKTEIGRVRAVDGISFDIYEGETLGLVGESGCGKSTAGTSVLRLEEPTAGKIIFDGEDIAKYNKKELKRFRRRAQFIFQDPESSFDPRMSIGESVAEPLYVQGMTDRKRRREIVVNLLERVGLNREDYNRYPHEFSGGQKQRIALARALVVNPDFVIADEPVSALDVSIQAEILGLMRDLKEEFGLSMLVISHDMGVIQEICDRVAVMYLGQIVEMASTEELFSNPQHPYTRALLSAIPTPDPRQRGMGVELRGDVPSPAAPPAGCRFHTRCPEIIQPDGYSFDQEIWRNIMHLRATLRKGVDLESIRELIVAENDGYEETDDVTESDLREGIRKEFLLPDRLDDPRADEVLADAIDAIVVEDFEAAGEELRAEFETICELEKPTLELVAPFHNASCHLAKTEGISTEAADEIPAQQD